MVLGICLTVELCLRQIEKEPFASPHNLFSDLKRSTRQSLLNGQAASPENPFSPYITTATL